MFACLLPIHTQHLLDVCNLIVQFAKNLSEVVHIEGVAVVRDELNECVRAVLAQLSQALHERLIGLQFFNLSLDIVQILLHFRDGTPGLVDMLSSIQLILQLPTLHIVVGDALVLVLQFRFQCLNLVVDVVHVPLLLAATQVGTFRNLICLRIESCQLGTRVGHLKGRTGIQHAKGGLPAHRVIPEVKLVIAAHCRALHSHLQRGTHIPDRDTVGSVGVHHTALEPVSGAIRRANIIPGIGLSRLHRPGKRHLLVLQGSRNRARGLVVRGRHVGSV
jgi:hypothetical protein